MTALWAAWPPATARLIAPQACLDVRFTASPLRWRQAEAFACWHRDGEPAPAPKAARAFGLPLKRMSSGYVAQDPAAAQPISFVVDEPQRLRELIQAQSMQAESPQALRLMRDLVALRITHNSAAALMRPPEVPQIKTSRRVLVTAGAGADLTAVNRMLDSALADNSGAEIWLHAAHAAHGVLAAHPGVRQVTSTVNSYVLLEHFDAVYAQGTILGFEALLAGLPVREFGAAFYAGWGLTQDAQPQSGVQTAPPSSASLAQVFEAAYLRHCHYLDAATYRSGTLADAMDMISLQRSVRRRYVDLGALRAEGFSRWKKPFVKPFLEAGGRPMLWGSGGPARPALWGAAGAPPSGPEPVRVEDGFLRSAGLGSDLAAPHSMVVDRKGIYFDPRQPSELTDLLNTPTTDPAVLARAEALRELICALRLSKYNFGTRAPAWSAPAGRMVVLVPGQVHDDASVRLGSAGIRTMEELLLHVRRARPDAFVVYKPHPDVLSGNRKGLVTAQALCDHVDTTSDLISLIERADEVHTLTSLAGFEALLRNKRVFTYGHPSFGGWGLTHDHVNNIANRHSALTLPQLIAGVLILYPLYWDWKLNLFTTPEATAHALARDLAREARSLLPNARSTVRPFAKALRWLRNVLFS